MFREKDHLIELINNELKTCSTDVLESIYYAVSNLKERSQKYGLSFLNHRSSTKNK